MPSSHIKHGFLAQVYEPWTQLGSNEFFEQLEPLREAMSHGEEYAGLTFEQLDQLEAMIRQALQIAHEDGWLLDMYESEIAAAVAEYPRARDYWYSRSLSFKAEDSFREAEQLVPDWMKP